MDLDRSTDYAWLRAHIVNLAPAGASDSRKVLWVDNDQRLGVARDPSGRVEIFVTGAALQAHSTLVASNLVHNAWQRVEEPDLVANRLLLPEAAHFDAVAAFLCAELVENGLLYDQARGFRRSEPVIELAIQRLALQDATLIGLIGELILLHTLAYRAASERVEQLVLGWSGHVRAARDIRLGTLGVEVKSTRGTTSTHSVAGVRQVELGHAVGGALETDFRLVSMGLAPVADDEPQEWWSLPGLVDGLILRLEEVVPDHAGALTAELLDRVQSYGTGDGEGYDHAQMKHRALHGQRWRTSFVRSYDMTDPLVKVIRTPDISQFKMVDLDSVQFVVELPKKVNGDLNPLVRLNAVADSLLSLAWP